MAVTVTVSLGDLLCLDDQSGGEPPPGTNERQHCARITGEVQDCVDSVGIARPYLCRDVGCVVHHLGGAEFSHEPPSLITARRRDHQCADLCGELHSDGTDASRCPHDEDRLAGRQFGGVNGEPRRRACEAERATRVKVDGLGKPRQADSHGNRHELAE